MFNKLLKSDIFEQSIKGLQDIQRKVENTLDEALKPIQEEHAKMSVSATKVDSLRAKEADKPVQLEQIRVEQSKKEEQCLTSVRSTPALFEPPSDAPAASEDLPAPQSEPTQARTIAVHREQISLEPSVTKQPPSTPPASHSTQNCPTFCQHFDALEIERKTSEKTRQSLMTEIQGLRADLMEISSMLANEVRLRIAVEAKLKVKAEEPCKQSVSPQVEPPLSVSTHETQSTESLQNPKISSLMAKLSDSEDLRKAMAEDNEVLRAKIIGLEVKLRERTDGVSTTGRNSSTLPSRSNASSTRDFEAALQAIGTLQDKLEEAEEKNSMLKSQLRAQIESGL